MNAKKIIAAILTSAAVISAIPGTGYKTGSQITTEAKAKNIKKAKALSDDVIKSSLVKAGEALAHGKNRKQRLYAVYTALSLVGKSKYRFGGMHGNYTTTPGAIEDVSDFKDSDSSGYISYILYKSGSLDSAVGLSVSGLKDHGRIVTDEEISPGDLIIKQTKRAKHVVMYIGKTDFGNFTVAECTVKNNISGPQVTGYKSFKDFVSRRGRGFKYVINPYKDGFRTSKAKKEKSGRGAV